MGKTYRLGEQSEDQTSRRAKRSMSAKKRLSGLCRLGYHAWMATLTAGLFVCSRCGTVGACSHLAVVPRGVERVSCGQSCRRVARHDAEVQA